MRQAGCVTGALRIPVPSCGTILQLTAAAKDELTRPFDSPIVTMLKNFKTLRMIIPQTIVRTLGKLFAGGIAMLRRL